MSKLEFKCEAGCSHFTCGSIKHHIHCKNYPESQSELINNLKKERDELREKVERFPKISKYEAFGCADRMCVDGIYFGYVDGEWQRAKSQYYAKHRYELGLEGGEV